MTTMFVDELGRIPMSPFLKATLARAAEYARAQQHREVTLEHLLLALAEDPEASVVLKLSNVDIGRLMSDVSSYLGRHEDRVDAAEAPAAGAISADLRRILEAAAAAAHQGRRREINGAIVLAAIVGDGKTASAHMLRAQGLTFEEAIRALQRMASIPPPAAASLPAPAPANPTPAAPAPAPVPEPAAAAPMPAPSPQPIAVGVPSPGPATAPPTPQQGAKSDLSLDEAVASIRRERAEPPPSAPGNWQPARPPQPSPHEGGAAPLPQSAPPAPQVPARNPTGPAGPPPAAGPPRGGRPSPSMGPATGPPMGPGVSPGMGPAMGPGTVPRPAGPMPGAPHGPGLGAPPPRPGAPWPGGQPQQPPYDDALARLDARRPPQAPGQTRMQTGGGAARPVAEPGQLQENLPRRMTVGVPVVAEVLIARAEVKNLAGRLQTGGAAYRHDISITRAMTVRLRAPDGGFTIETTSPETQWIENILNLAETDAARWRWTVTPRRRGKKRLQLVVSARTVDAEGLTAETALPDKVIDVRVSINYLATTRRWLGWIAAAIAGGLLARFGEHALDTVQAFLNRGGG